MKKLQNGLSIDTKAFMEFVMKEMDWNDPRIYEIHKVSDDSTELYNLLGITNDKWTVSFSYDCLAGSSVIPELNEAISKFSTDPHDVKVRRGIQTRKRDFRHDYYIIFK